MSDGRHTSELRSVSRCRMRARSSTWTRRVDRPPAYRRGANYRTYKPSAISRGAQAKPGPRAMHIQRTPGLGARGPNDATTISETNPLMINKVIRQPRRTRERLADNVSAEYSWVSSAYRYVEEVKEILVGANWQSFGIALICLFYIRAINR